MEIKKAEPATPALGKVAVIAEPRRWPVQILAGPEDRREEFAFDYRWNRFSEVGNARNMFNAVR